MQDDVDQIGVKPNNPSIDACNVNQLTANNWLASGCKANFTTLCSKGNTTQLIAMYTIKKQHYQEDKW